MNVKDEVDAFLIATAGIDFDTDWMRVADTFFKSADRSNDPRFAEWIKRQTTRDWLSKNAGKIAVWANYAQRPE